MATKTVLLEVLSDLLEREFKEFKWHLSNSDIPIPKGKLENADRHDVVDLMVQQYGKPDAGKIAVIILREMKQNELAEQLKRKLQEASVQSPEEVDGRIVYRVNTGIVNNPGSVRQQRPIQLNWKRPEKITPCSQEFKDKLLRENKDIYVPMKKSLRKGLALLITNIHNRRGAEKDEENMEWLLTALGYKVVKHTNLSGEEIDYAVRNFAALPEHQDSDSTFVVIMSHGGKVNNKDAITGVYNTGRNDHFFVEKVFSHLNSENCPALSNKPKVIIIQACRGGESGGVEMSDSESDDFGGVWEHKEKDFACFMSSVPNVKAYRRSDIGSYFICYILLEFCERAHKEHIMDLFLKVTSDMAEHPDRKENKLLSCIERTTLTKRFFLFPGL